MVNKREVQRRWHKPKVAQWRMELREKVSNSQGHQCMVCNQTHHLVLAVTDEDDIGAIRYFLLCDLCNEVYNRLLDKDKPRSKSQVKRLIILGHGHYCKGG